MTAGAHLTLRGVTCRFGEITAVDDVTLDLAPGSLTSLVGPSGCGKSTLVSVIAGLRSPDRGSVAVDGVDVTHVPPEERPVNVVFQKPLLLPHLDVRDNVAFALRMRGERRRTARAVADEMLERVDLPGFGGRAIQSLSGGQEQRVAVARALVGSPRVLLLDEPFSALDTTLRESMRALVRVLVAESGVTTLFVTHDRAEALQGDAAALMDRGALLGCGTPREMYEDPPSVTGARLLGDVNELDGTVTGGTFGLPGTSTSVPADLPDGPATLAIRPESLRLGPSPSGDGFVATGRLVASRFAGDGLVVQVEVGTHLVTMRSSLEEAPVTGEIVHVWSPATHCRVFAG